MTASFAPVANFIYCSFIFPPSCYGYIKDCHLYNGSLESTLWNN